MRTTGDLAAQVAGELLGDPHLPIRGVNGLLEASADELSFYGNARYRGDFEKTRAGAVLVTPDTPPRTGVTTIRVAQPHLAFARISTLFHPYKSHVPGVSPQAHVHPDAQVDASATVMAGATVEKGALVGARSVLYPGVFIGERAKVGTGCILYPNAVVYDHCILGDRVILHASSVVGADGFGFAFNPDGPEHFKIPQAGIARLEDDVELGASSCVDRATLGETVVGRGTKIDNLVQIAHNVKVGPLSILCAHVGIAGSTELGAGVVMGGQAGAINHLKIGDGVKVGAKSAVMADVPPGASMSGYPAMEQKEWLKNSAAQPQLAALLKEVRQLRRRLEAVEKKSP